MRASTGCRRKIAARKATLLRLKPEAPPLSFSSTPAKSETDNVRASQESPAYLVRPTTTSASTPDSNRDAMDSSQSGAGSQSPSTMAMIEPRAGAQPTYCEAHELT